MKWGLLLDDLAARLFGVIGAYVCAIYINHALIANNTQFSLPFKVGLILFLIAITMVYLLPNLHDRILQRSLGFLGRFMFVILSLTWGFLVVLGLEISVRFEMGYLPVQWDQNLVIAMLFGFSAYVLLFLFPGGIAYRYAAERRLSAQPAYYHPGEAHGPEAEAKLAKGPRKRDLFDLLAYAPLLGVVGVSAFAFTTDNVAPTQELDAWLYDNVLIGIAATAALILFKPAVTLMRRPLIRKRRVHSVKRLLWVIFALPTFSAMIFFAAAYHGFPWLYQQLHEDPVGSRIYVVAKSGYSGVLSDCLGLHYLDMPDHDFTLCGLEKDLTQRVRVGTRIQAIGALSQFGHSFTEVSVARSVPRAPSAPIRDLAPSLEGAGFVPPVQPVTN